MRPNSVTKRRLPCCEHEHHLAVGIVEMLIDHRFGDEIDMRGHAGLGVGVACRGHGLHALQEGQSSFGIGAGSQRSCAIG